MERALDAMERMTDRFDRAATLNFTTVVECDGVLPDEALRRALRAVEARHPLLRSAITEGGAGDGPRFVPGAAAEIPVDVEDGDAERVQTLVQRSLVHRPWALAGPRGYLRVVRMGSERSILLLTLHHTVSDGSSGFLLVRDLLRASQGLPLGGHLPSPGPKHFLPPPTDQTSAAVRRMLDELAALGQPSRFQDQEAPAAQRVPHVRVLRLTRSATDRMLSRCKGAGGTVQGWLVAVLARAVAAELTRDRAHESVVLRVGHPVDLRRYLDRWHGGQAEIGERVGYYVSAVDTAHRVGRQQDLPALAREVSTALQMALERGYPLLTGPVAGVTLHQRTVEMADEAFRAFAEQHAMLGAFGLSNLGRLEALGLSGEVGALRVRSGYFVTASSVFGALGAAASTFAGRLTLALQCVAPLMGQDRFERVAAQVAETLEA